MLNSMFSYCGRNSPDDITLMGPAAKRGLKVTFMSDKKKEGRGAQCVAHCIVTTTSTASTITTMTTTTTSGMAQRMLYDEKLKTHS